jgi:hypothetical protein
MKKSQSDKTVGIKVFLTIFCSMIGGFGSRRHKNADHMDPNPQHWLADCANCTPTLEENDKYSTNHSKYNTSSKSIHFSRCTIILYLSLAGMTKISKLAFTEQIMIGFWKFGGTANKIKIKTWRNAYSDLDPPIMSSKAQSNSWDSLFKVWPGSAWIRIGLAPWIRIRIHNRN